MQIVKCLLILALMSSLASPAFGQEPDAPEEVSAPAEEGETAGAEDASEGGEQGEAVSPGAAIYIPLTPPFVVNYGGPGRLKFLKADISVRLESAAAASSVRHHMPYIRNNLVMLFSAQSEESVASQEGKEALRQEALREVRQVIKQEDGQEGVVDLYFNSIIVQR